MNNVPSNGGSSLKFPGALPKLAASVGLLVLSSLAVGPRAEASISVNAGDTVTFTGQAYPGQTGEGGQFNWTVASVASANNGISSSVGTPFTSFCAEIANGATISTGNTYAISGIISNLAIGQAVNSVGTTLQNTQGLFLFDELSLGKITSSVTNLAPATVSAVVQYALWTSEGYSPSQSILGTNSASTLAGDASSLLGSLGYNSATWKIDPNEKVMVLTNGQDQYIYINAPPSSGVPEPASFVIWGVLGLAGVATALRSKKAKTL